MSAGRKTWRLGFCRCVVRPAGWIVPPAGTRATASRQAVVTGRRWWLRTTVPTGAIIVMHAAVRKSVDLAARPVWHTRPLVCNRARLRS
jgi:hypothetical protein